MRSVMNHSFSKVPAANIPRSSFDRSCGYKTTFDAGYLIPVFIDEALPGDTFSVSMAHFTRMTTPIVPLMDNLFLDSFFFFVPWRLIWDNWERMNGAQTDPADSTDFITPVMTSPGGGYAVGSLSDYMGIRTGVAGIVHQSAWHRAYNLIWNEWLRDENLQDSVVVDRDDGPDDPADYVLLKRGKRHDYFTSVLPWPQKGPSVELPLGDTAPVLGIGAINQTFPQAGPQTVYESNAASTSYSDAKQVSISTQSNEFWVQQDPDNAGFPFIRADLSAATASTINQLRQAFQIQKLFERDARGGTRYTEIVRSHFGVISPDARLQRPEYLGGGSTPINIHPVPQTSNTVTGSPQGNLAAFATASAAGHGFSKSFTEHGLVVGLVSVRADLNYQQGLPRMFSRRSRFDFYWPALSHIGEQAVLNKEIFVQGTSDDEEVFGYQERWAEYRYKPSLITGKFRSDAAGSLDIWHAAQDFASLPALSPEFIEEDPPMDRILAVADEPAFLFDSYFTFRAARPMPTYSVPGLIDHF